MPYIRQRTWLQTAPRRGMGQGPCDPGFTGPLTPEEQAACAAAVTTPTVSPCDPSFQGPLTPDQLAACAAAGQPKIYRSGVDPVSQFVAQYKTPLLIGGVGFGVLLLLKALR